MTKVCVIACTCTMLLWPLWHLKCRNELYSFNIWWRLSCVRLHECEHKFYELKRHKLNQLRDSIVIFDYTPGIYNSSFGRTIFLCFSVTTNQHQTPNCVILFKHTLFYTMFKTFEIWHIYTMITCAKHGVYWYMYKFTKSDAIVKS